jgi:hypothetical protein
MYRDITQAQWIRIRRRLLGGGVSQKQIERETGTSRKTVRKMIEFLPQLLRLTTVLQDN